MFSTATLLRCKAHGSRIAGVWLGFEMVFFIVRRVQYTKLNRVSIRPGADFSVPEAVQNLKLMFDVMSPQGFFSGWFNGVPFSDLTRSDVLEVLSFGCR